MTNLIPVGLLSDKGRYSAYFSRDVIISLPAGKLALPHSLSTTSFQRMCSDTSGSTEEDKPIFRPLTRDSLAQIQARIDSEHAKKKELEKKRAEGEVGGQNIVQILSISYMGQNQRFHRC